MLWFVFCCGEKQSRKPTKVIKILFFLFCSLSKEKKGGKRRCPFLAVRSKGLLERASVAWPSGLSLYHSFQWILSSGLMDLCLSAEIAVGTAFLQCLVKIHGKSI